MKASEISIVFCNLIIALFSVLFDSAENSKMYTAHSDDFSHSMLEISDVFVVNDMSKT